MSQLIRVLVVDDSAFVRKVVREMLSRSPFIEVVGAARDGEEALELAESLKPDVVTCDLMMPKCNGVAFVRAQMERRPLPILILTATPEDGEMAVEAMQAGAVDIVKKPTALASPELLEIQTELIEKVKSVARMTVKDSKPREAVPAPHVVRDRSLRADIVAIGLSTGGPQAIRQILAALPDDFPVPVAIVLHMPIGYTGFLAQKLDEICPLQVTEAQEGDLVLPGRVIVARAGHHLWLTRNARGEVVASLRHQPNDSPHRPSVDALFESVANAYGERVLAVVMTGMGSDGAKGAAWVKAKGGVVLTEAEESCVVYGMPRAVVEAGLSDGAFALSEMANAIANRL